MKQVVLVAHDIRSALNVGSLLRTADGLGVEKVYLTGYTPYPAITGDSRLPHLAQKVDKRINKTALGAERSVSWHYEESLPAVIEELKRQGYEIAALEQSVASIRLDEYEAPDKVALLVGSEVGGLSRESLAQAAVILEIPMRGRKESFNVAAAAAMALYHLTWLDK